MVRKRTYCVDCPQFVSGDPNGNCKKFPWIIGMRIARFDKVCYYTSFKDKFFDEPDPNKPEPTMVAWRN